MSQLLTSFGIFFGFIALLIVGVRGMTPESFALAAIVVVCGMLVALFVVDGLNGKAPASNKTGWLRKSRRRLKKHRVLWALPLLGLGAWAGYHLLAGESANVSTSAPSSAPTAVALSRATPPAAPQTPLIAAPAATDPQAPAQEASGLDAKQEVEATVEAWRSAWSKKDVDTYLAAYAPEFKPADGLELDAWRKQRLERLALAKDIQVDVVDPTTEVNGETATVRFQQRYQAGTFKDRMRKQLTLTRRGGQWKITEERPETKGKP